MEKSQKYKLKDEVKGWIEESNATILTEYRGLTCGELGELRAELRKSDAKMTVVKNRIVIKAIEDGLDYADELKPSLKGPTALVTVKGDIAGAAKSLLNFAKDHEFLKIKDGLFEKKKVTKEDLKAISELPSKEELLAKIVGSLVSPHRGLLGVMSGVQRNLVQVIKAIADQKA